MADKTFSSLAKGTYSGATAYTVGDFVTYLGSSYACIVNTTGNLPTNTTYWALLAQKGDTGTAATIEVGSVTTLSAGSSATIVNSGSSAVAVFDFGIPRGDTGATGTSFVWKGAYDNGTAYTPRDTVSYLGSSYTNILASTGNLPTNPTYWELMVQRGDDGTGTVNGPVASTASNIALFGDTSGDVIEDSGVKISDLVDKASFSTSHSVLVGAGSSTYTQTIISQNSVLGRTTGSVTALLIDSDLSSVSASDDTVPSAKAVKSYADSGTATVTNKRPQLRVYSATASNTLVIDKTYYDAYQITAQSANMTIAASSTATLAGFEKVQMQLLGNGSSNWTIGFSADFVAKAGVALPTGLTGTKNMELGFEWNANLGKYNLLAKGNET